jgi:hypothetical protein
VTAPGRDTRDACEELTWTVCESARVAMNVWVVGGLPCPGGRSSTSGLARFRWASRLAPLVTGRGSRSDVGPVARTQLDFGKSPEIVRVAPDLASTEFEATGEPGIGFFSVFMWADRVEVTSRHFRAGSTDCYRLEFGSGLVRGWLSLQELQPHAKETMRSASSTVMICGLPLTAPHATEGISSTDWKAE